MISNDGYFLRLSLHALKLREQLRCDAVAREVSYFDSVAFSESRVFCMMYETKRHLWSIVRDGYCYRLSRLKPVRL